MEMMNWFINFNFITYYINKISTFCILIKKTFIFIFRFVVYNNNQFDSVPIRLGLSSSDQLIVERTSLLEKIGLARNSEVEVLPAPRYISPELLGFVRIFNMNEGISILF